MGLDAMDFGIKIERLNSKNYSIWKFKVKMLLIKEDLWDVVDNYERQEESLEPRASVSRIDDSLRKKENRALATICLLVEDSQLVHVKDCTSAGEAWKNLRNHHEKNSLTSRLYLRKKLLGLKLDKNGDMEEHIAQVMMTGDQLRSAGDAIKDEELVTVLLCGLPEQYDSLITALESRNAADLTLEFVKSRLIHESLKVKNSDRETETALKASKPNGFQKKIQDQVEKRNCFYCGKPGHLKKDCRKRQSNLQRKASKAMSEDEHCFSVKEMDSNCSKMVWFVDSGATNHMSSEKDLFEEIEECNKNIYLADDRIVKAFGKGDIILKTKDGDSVRLKEVLYIPKLGSNLFSVSKCLRFGYSVKFDKSRCEISKENKVVMTATSINGMFKLELEDLKACAASTSENDTLVWHRRLGHLNVQYMKQMQVCAKVKDEDIANCEACILAKMKRTPFPSVNSRQSSAILELIHSDVCGPMQTASIGGKKYFVTFIDDFSRMMVVYLMASKSEVLDRFRDYVQFMQASTEKKILKLRSDNGGEYCSSAFKKFCNINGIQHQLSAPYSPQQNGVAERVNRTLVEMAKCLLFDAKMSKNYWGEAIVTACYLKNRQPHKLLELKTPYEIWYSKRPDLSHLRIFGSIVYAHVPKENRQKLDDKAIRCKFLGYVDGVKGYRLVSEASGKIIISRDVKFIDDRLIFKSISENVLKNKESEAEVMFDDRATDQTEKYQESRQVNSSESLSTEETIQSSVTNEELSSSGTASNLTEELRRSARMNKGVPPLKFDPMSCLALASVDQPPTSYQEAIKDQDADCWLKAMDSEMESLKKNNTWQLVSLPNDQVAIPLKWVYQLKHDAGGNIVKHKARIVVKGFMQEHGKNFSETFAPVAKFTTLRILLSIAASENLSIHQMDVSSAFLQGDLKEDVYVCQPVGYEVRDKEHMVYKLNKSLYGLKQAPFQWNQTIHQFLISIDFKRSATDWCVYTMISSSESAYLLVYVDDLIIAGSSEALVKHIKVRLQKRFDIKDLGPISYFLGISIERDQAKQSIYLSQKSYAKSILEKFGFQDCKPVQTPQEVGYRSDNVTDSTEKFPYREAVGSLMYLMVSTRPDLASVISVLSRKLDSYDKSDIVLLKRTLRYLNGSIDLKLELGGKRDTLNFYGYVDADWAGSSDRKSTSGYVLKINGGSVVWASKRQSTVALSTTEAEYIAASAAVQEIIWCRSLLMELNYPCKDPTILFEDNKGCISVSENTKNHGRSKHYDIKYHFVREKVANKEVKLVYCSSHEMIADMLTKPLSSVRFSELRTQMGLLNY